MIKRTLYFGNPAYLSVRLAQLEIRLPEVEKNSTLPNSFKESSIKRVPIEDIGVMILDHKQITITQGAMGALLDNNVAVITCDDHCMPTGLMLPLAGNTTQSERFRHQIEASLPLKKQLWQQTIQAKILNQSTVLYRQRDLECGNMEAWAKQVKSGDVDNLEGRAAAFYWQNLFGNIEGFHRDREGIPPNNLLNYGYAILRAVVARSLVGSGLLPTMGIHHHNRYNAYCLADDLFRNRYENVIIYPKNKVVKIFLLVLVIFSSFWIRAEALFFEIVFICIAFLKDKKLSLKTIPFKQRILLIIIMVLIMILILSLLLKS